MLRRTSLVFALSCQWCVATPSAAQTGTLEKIRRDGAMALDHIENAAPFSAVDAKGEPQG